MDSGGETGWASVAAPRPTVAMAIAVYPINLLLAFLSGRESHGDHWGAAPQHTGRRGTRWGCDSYECAPVRLAFKKELATRVQLTDCHWLPCWKDRSELLATILSRSCCSCQFIIRVGQGSMRKWPGSTHTPPSTVEGQFLWYDGNSFSCHKES